MPAEHYTLSQLNSLVQETVRESFPSRYWVMAETSDVRVNNRHCYLEFVEKNEKSNVPIAKARGYIWASTFDMLKPYFEQQTGQAFVSGIKILVKVSIDLHPVYGYGLTVHDIDPAYTLGDMHLKRQAILKRLEEEGVLHLNKELQLAELPQRIAVISSATAAGYEDFLKQLKGNAFGFVFYPRLFPAVMQGEQTEKSIIDALNRIYQYQECFDAVAILRGGGSASDLASFDSYLLAANCAQFPLPVITGIGHERDETVLDYVAHHREKTPTAVAEYFIGRSRRFYEQIIRLQKAITDTSLDFLENSATQLERAKTRFPLLVSYWVEKQKNKLHEKETFLKLSSPDYILAKGYSITLKDGKAVKSSNELKPGDELETVLREGRVKSKVG